MKRQVSPRAVVRAQALFTSTVPTGSHPSRAEVTGTVRRAVRDLGGARACANEVAAAYGERPETAVPRMRWALDVVSTGYAPPCQGAGRLRRVTR